VFTNPYTFVHTAGATWSTPETFPLGTHTNCFTIPSGISFNGKLYVFVECSSVLYTSRNSSGNWSAVSWIPGAQPGATIGLAVYSNRLYAIWRAWSNNTSLFYASMGTDGIWSATARLSTGESGASPTAAVLTGSDGHNDNLLYKKMSSSGQWMGEVDTGWDVTATAPSLVYFNGQMWLIYRYKYIQNGGVYFLRYQIVN
jgi:hypothetical protein